VQEVGENIWKISQRITEATEKIGEATKRGVRSYQVKCERELKEVRESSEIGSISN
jgi:hypothetical protein